MVARDWPYLLIWEQFTTRFGDLSGRPIAATGQLAVDFLDFPALHFRSFGQFAARMRWTVGRHSVDFTGCPVRAARVARTGPTAFAKFH